MNVHALSMVYIVITANLIYDGIDNPKTTVDTEDGDGGICDLEQK